MDGLRKFNSVSDPTAVVFPDRRIGVALPALHGADVWISQIVTDNARNPKGLVGDLVAVGGDIYGVLRLHSLPCGPASPERTDTAVILNALISLIVRGSLESRTKNRDTVSENIQGGLRVLRPESESQHGSDASSAAALSSIHHLSEPLYTQQKVVQLAAIGAFSPLQKVSLSPEALVGSGAVALTNPVIANTSLHNRFVVSAFAQAYELARQSSLSVDRIIMHLIDAQETPVEEVAFSLSGVLRT